MQAMPPQFYQFTPTAQAGLQMRHENDFKLPRSIRRRQLRRVPSKQSLARTWQTVIVAQQVIEMNCPHCQKELPENYSENQCPFCAGNLGRISDSSNIPQRKFPWLFFGVVMSLPAVADFLLVNFISNSMDTLGVMLSISFLGSGISGIVCGSILARWKGGPWLQIISHAAAYSLLMAFASLSLCSAGCTASAVIQSVMGSYK